MYFDIRGASMLRRTVLVTTLVSVIGGCVTSSQENINDFFERKYSERIELYPESMSYLGLHKDYDKLDDISEKSQTRDYQLALNDLQEIKAFNPAQLSHQERISLELYEEQLKSEIDSYKYRFQNYPVNQMFGYQSSFPSLMINIHLIENKEDALAYIARLKAVSKKFDQVIDQLTLREKKGVIAPKFALEKAINASKNIIKGFPFDQSKKGSTLYTDFTKKLKKTKISSNDKKHLEEECKKALLNSVQPAYKKLIAKLDTLKVKSADHAGAWMLPDGHAYYQYMLQKNTSTQLTAKQIHEIGLSEVDRIHKEMHGIIKKLNFKGSLKQFFQKVQSDPKFQIPQTQKGREKFLRITRNYIKDIKEKLPELFEGNFNTPMIVKAVEAYREAAMPPAFYNSPSPDGKRPGIYYINLFDMSRIPLYKLESLSYHEGIPGHHMERSFSQQLTELPKFRRYAGYNAFIEGWGLYSEQIPKEIGFYKDPYSDFGRLTWELWRATRLVVDTGIHWKKWSRQKAIDYLMENTPSGKAEVVVAVERYIVMPGQATSYKIGLLKILELRAKAEKKLGDKFDLRKFHTQILKNGPLPLTVLESEFNRWLTTL